MANQFLALSMFIMLLSFFIVLNTMSEFEDERSRPVLNSVISTFGSQPVVSEPSSPSPDTTPVPGHQKKEGDVMDNIEGLFTSRIAGVKVKRDRFGSYMILEIPLEEFERVLLDVGAWQTPLTQTLVSVMHARRAQPYRIDVFLGVGRNPAVYANREPARARAKIRKVAQFTQTLEEAGMPHKLISAGLSAGSRKYVELRFERYEPLGTKAAQERQTTESGSDSDSEQRYK